MAGISKTKLQVIEVARQLFARFGVQRTTMNDIADAAKKGRRTLYTYFKSKEAVVDAVIDTELKKLWREIEIAQRLNIGAEDKFFNLIRVHLDTMKMLVLRNGSLRAEFFRDIWFVEKARHSFDRYERRVITKILEQGVEQGVFLIPNCQTMAFLLQNAIKGMEVPFICGHISPDKTASFELIQQNMQHLILRGIKKA